VVRLGHSQKVAIVRKCETSCKNVVKKCSFRFFLFHCFLLKWRKEIKRARKIKRDKGSQIESGR